MPELKLKQPDDMLITGAHAAELVGVSPTTFYRMSREHEGLAPAPTAGQSSVWYLQSVLSWIQARDAGEQARREALVHSWTEGNPDGGNTK